jgi:hypothetical protein
VPVWLILEDWIRLKEKTMLKVGWTGLNTPKYGLRTSHKKLVVPLRCRDEPQMFVILLRLRNKENKNSHYWQSWTWRNHRSLYRQLKVLLSIEKGQPVFLLPGTICSTTKTVGS